MACFETAPRKTVVSIDVYQSFLLVNKRDFGILPDFRRNYEEQRSIDEGTYS